MIEAVPDPEIVRRRAALSGSVSATGSRNHGRDRSSGRIRVCQPHSNDRQHLATATKETALALTAFGYAVVIGTEGVALHLRKPWARWFTIIATGSFIPVEIYEIIREIHLIRVLVMVANIGIVVYLWQRKDMSK